MARSYAQLHQRIWADPTWRSLDVDAQHLYLLLISQPQINLAGVLPLQPRRWASCVAGWDVATVTAALGRLRAGRFVVVDEDTEEVLVRSLIRNDGGYRTPGMLKSILRHSEGTQGAALRTVLAIELGRLDPLEGKKAEEGMALIAATRLALLPSPPTPPTPTVIHSSDGIGDTIGEPMADGIGDTFLGTHRGYLPESISDAIADTSVTGTGSVTHLSSVDRWGGTRAHAKHDEPPQCPKHTGMDRADVPDCGPCGRLRRRWEDDQAEAARPRPKPMPPLCGQCDDRWIDTPGGYVHCPRCHPAEVRPA